MLDELFKDAPLTDAERKMISTAETANTAEISRAKITSDLYMIKKAGILVDRMIESNRLQSESNGKYAHALNRLTFWLVLVGLLQVIVQILFMFRTTH